jgi:hypothetical protein
MKLSESKASDHEVDVFKALHSAGPNVITHNGHIMAKRKRRVMVKDHRILGPVYREVMSEFRKLNSHGAENGPGAFNNNELADPPSRQALSDQRKKKPVPNNGHHGGAPAPWPPLDPRVASTSAPTAEIARRAPGHASYFTKPNSVVMDAAEASTKNAGSEDDLQKRDPVAYAVQQAQRRPFGSPDEI